MFLFKAKQEKKNEEKGKSTEICWAPRANQTPWKVFSHVISLNTDSNAIRQPGHCPLDGAGRWPRALQLCAVGVGSEPRFADSESMLCPRPSCLEGNWASIHSTSPLCLHASPPCVQDWAIRKRITSFPPAQIHSTSLQTRSLTNTFSLGKSPKKRIILTTAKSISKTTPETSKNQLPSKVGSLTKGQRCYRKPQVDTLRW